MDTISKQPPQLVGKGFKPGVSGNPAGRPKGPMISIKEEIRKHLEENPEAVKKIVEHFIEKNRELMWTMLEGSPKSTVESKNTNVEISITGEDLLLAKELERRRQIQTSSPESNGADSSTLG